MESARAQDRSIRQQTHRIRKLGREVRSQFIQTEMAFALTLAEMAVAKGQRDTRAHTLRNMEAAYAALRRAMPHAGLTHSQKTAILKDLQELKALLIVFRNRQQ